MSINDIGTLLATSTAKAALHNLTPRMTVDRPLRRRTAEALHIGMFHFRLELGHRLHSSRISTLCRCVVLPSSGCAVVETGFVLGCNGRCRIASLHTLLIAVSFGSRSLCSLLGYQHIGLACGIGSGFGLEQTIEQRHLGREARASDDWRQSDGTEVDSAAHNRHTRCRVVDQLLAAALECKEGECW